MKTLTSALVLTFALQSAAQAATVPQNDYFVVGSDATTELETSIGSLQLLDDASGSTSAEIDEATVVADKLILLGQKLWKFVEAGKPVANFSSQRADIVPQGIAQWQDLAGWQIPVSKRYERVIKNKWGAQVVTFRYRIIYNYGGNFNGQGSYLMGVTVYPEVVDVAWGWSFDATASIPTIANAGSTKNPVAAAEVLISSKIRTPLAHLDNTESYYVRADGAFVDLQN